MSGIKATLFLLTGILLMVGGSSLLVYLAERRATAIEERMTAGQKALEAGDPEAAATAFAEVLERDPEQRDAAAALFDIVVYFDREEARDLLKALRTMGARLETVLSRQARFSVLEGDLETARKAVQSLDSLADPGLDGRLAKLDLLVAEGDFEAAFPLLAELRETWPGSRRVRLLESRVLASGPNVLQHIRAKQGLLSLLAIPDEVAFKAAAILCLDTTLPLFPPDRIRAAEALEQHPRLGAGLPQLEAPTLRGLALRLAGLRPSLAFRITEFLVSHPGSTQEDAILHLYAGQNSGNWEAVSETSRELTDFVTENGQEALLLVRQQIAEDKPEAALTLIETYRVSHPEDPTVLKVLSDLAAAHLDTLSDETKIRLAEAFRRHPGSIPGQYLQATALLMEVQPDERDALFKAAIARLAADYRPALGSWLLRLGEPARVLELIPEAEALSDEGLFFLHLNALLENGQPTAALNLLDRADVLLPAWQQDLERANIHLIREDPVACRELLHTIPQRLPADSQRALFTIGQMAGAIGDTSLMRHVFDEAFAHGLIFPVQHSMAYLSQLLDEGDFEHALDFTAYCRNVRPDNPYYINNHTYLKLIGGRWNPKCISDMEVIVEAHPEVTEFRLSYALALMFGGYPGRAMEALAPIGSDNIPYEPRSRMAYALVLAGTGAQEEAAPLIRSIDLAQMMEAEQVLVDRYLRDGRF